ncbi:MAG: AMP-binding protein, partial [Granulosicoccus sp.]|nr:AMP-binding protein [Granulosicoccus sp.]
IRTLSNQLAHVLRGLQLGVGDRLALILPQRIETALGHIAAHKLGAVSLPLSILFGVNALRYRLQDSGASVLITDREHAKLVLSIRSELPALKAILVVDQNEADGTATADSLNFWSELSDQPVTLEPVMTKADDPALLIYTSGTTGPPKGALVAHRSLIGNLTGFEMSMNFFPWKDDVFYTPADWAWTGGLFDGLLPTWFFGRPIVGYEYRKFNAERMLRLLEKYQVTTGFIPPTALKMLRAVPDINKTYQLKLRAVMSAGEMVGEELYHWAQQSLGVDINEMYGQTEHNYMVGNCSAIMPPKPGSMGKAYPGHQINIMLPDGSFAETGEMGEFVAHRDDAVHFLGYWNNPDATAAKFTGDWFHTGDTGYRDEDNFLWFVGRTDDVITSAGYRIGPGEIEDCVLQHPDVLQVAAVGVPDPQGVRGDIVKVFVVPKEGREGDDGFADEIQTLVRENLAAYEYPRAVEFLDELPMTTTGKVRRIELRQRDIEASREASREDQR